MIQTAGTNFLKHIFSGSIPDIANIVEAEARNSKDILIGYLSSVRDCIDKWITEIEGK